MAGLFVGLLLVLLWLMAAHRNPGLLNRDWVAFDRAGWRALGGDWAAAYQQSAEERWPYLYPPLSIPISLPLGLLPYQQSYWLCLVAGLSGMWWSCRRLREILGDQGGRYLIFCSVLLLAPTTVQVLVTGQWSWMYLMALTALAVTPGQVLPRGSQAEPPLLAAAPGLGPVEPNSVQAPVVQPTSLLRRRLWEEATPVPAVNRRAAYCLVLLAFKPNLAIFAVVFLIVVQQWQMLRRWMVALTVTVALTGPFAWRAWLDFLRAVLGVAQRQESGQAPVDKQTTLLAFSRVLSGDLSGTAVVWALWLGMVIPVLVLAAMAWRKLARTDRYRLRLVGVLALVMVAANPRLYFYDALILTLPAAAWYLDRDSYGRARWRRIGGACLAGIVVASGCFFAVPAIGTGIGLLAAVWAIAESFDLIGISSAPVPLASPVDASPELEELAPTASDPTIAMLGVSGPA